ncbi:hypothetical protein C7449_107279 [Mycoplana dimorpha]|uniref:Uncharacterized protein n=1 Tax=Mycoplana dimorpha TaxID=28320 RepID=A0A2T5B1N1_MYCDI|nr:hypothetical protein C7449_107279 [Mycoplana dimorpha]
MDNWLKVLVATACTVVIVGGAYYGWGQYTLHRESTARSERVEGARKELFDLAKAQSWETEKVRDFCKRYRGYLDTSLKGNDYAAALVRNCRALGYLF